jgi:hypothetical protein
MSFCNALTLTEGLKNGPDVNGRSKFAENFTPGQHSIQGSRLNRMLTRRLG